MKAHILGVWAAGVQLLGYLQVLLVEINHSSYGYNCVFVIKNTFQLFFYFSTKAHSSLLSQDILGRIVPKGSLRKRVYILAIQELVDLDYPIALIPKNLFFKIYFCFFAETYFTQDGLYDRGSPLRVQGQIPSVTPQGRFFLSNMPVFRLLYLFLFSLSSAPFTEIFI